MVLWQVPYVLELLVHMILGALEPALQLLLDLERLAVGPPHVVVVLVALHHAPHLVDVELHVVLPAATLVAVDLVPRVSLLGRLPAEPTERLAAHADHEVAPAVLLHGLLALRAVLCVHCHPALRLGLVRVGDFLRPELPHPARAGRVGLLPAAEAEVLAAAAPRLAEEVALDPDRAPAVRHARAPAGAPVVVDKGLGQRPLVAPHRVVEALEQELDLWLRADRATLVCHACQAAAPPLRDANLEVLTPALDAEGVPAIHGRGPIDRNFAEAALAEQLTIRRLTADAVLV
mmetsp:Transcript_19487/g.46509  ORF Transcript_19487/g.46509 Transcript_19487/m.46509 type:complete len:290 (+) Transcript_19487:721-1590(+)